MPSRKASHPAHPAVVHFPLAFLFTAQLLDISYLAATHPSTSASVARIYDLKPFLSDIARLGHLLMLFGVIFAIPAIATGALEMVKLMDRQAVADKLKNSNNKKAVVAKTHPKVKVAFLHAGLMDLVAISMGYNWWIRRSNPGVAPNDLNVMISAAGAVLLSVAGYLGSSLVYTHGVGVDMAGMWAKKEA